jgi:hypothetical protein
LFGIVYYCFRMVDLEAIVHELLPDHFLVMGNGDPGHPPTGYRCPANTSLGWSHASLSMPSLRDLLLIDLEANTIEHTSRPNDNTAWTLRIGNLGDTLELNCPASAKISVAEVFA